MFQLLVFLNFREFKGENRPSKSCQCGIFTHDDISNQKHVDRKHNSYSMISGYQPHLTNYETSNPNMSTAFPTTSWPLVGKFHKNHVFHQRLKRPTNPANRCLLAVTMPHDFAISACIPGEIDRETPGKLTTVGFFWPRWQNRE